jgi:hypothetical protein
MDNILIKKNHLHPEAQRDLGPTGIALSVSKKPSLSEGNRVESSCVFKTKEKAPKGGLFG